MISCTLWSRKNKVGEMEFNHLSLGHEAGDKPTPKHPNQVSPWSQGVWASEHAFLDDRNRVIHQNV
jgi:hypothetical protein